MAYIKFHEFVNILKQTANQLFSLKLDARKDRFILLFFSLYKPYLRVHKEVTGEISLQMHTS